ncbi:hypothetical protein HMPREF0970_00636 [Schaalia odontolytica F0309]|uniref:Uncharacterized protein n=1 Tax=Schaalia odontolytica F0309 TaxID=649742 RepID=D4TXH3_9ACTO|nr:hypothetical protein HMPREF0970_00636 [Schaalia odontolytica F0309]
MPPWQPGLVLFPSSSYAPAWSSSQPPILPYPHNFARHSLSPPSGFEDWSLKSCGL